MERLGHSQITTAQRYLQTLPGGRRCSRVQAMDPQLLVTLVERPGLQAVADEAGKRLAAALGQLPPPA